jgi:hypothetical protein
MQTPNQSPAFATAAAGAHDRVPLLAKPVDRARFASESAMPAILRLRAPMILGAAASLATLPNAGRRC